MTWTSFGRLGAHVGDAGASVWTWELDPVAIVAAGIAAALYLRAWTRLRGRGRADLASSARLLAFGGGVALGLLAVTSPIHALGERSLSGHMAQHLLLGDIAPALIVVGLVGPIGLMMVPRPVLRRVGRSPRLRATARSLSGPFVAILAWAAMMGAWHLPAVHEAALRSPVLHAFQHATMIATGLMVWLVVLDPARTGRLSPAARAGVGTAVLLTGMVLAEVLLASEPLYPTYGDGHLPFGLTAGQDQMRAGLIMMAEPFLTLAPAAALLLRLHVETAEATSVRATDA